jgi:hypothetical protein
MNLVGNSRLLLSLIQLIYKQFKKKSVVSLSVIVLLKTIGPMICPRDVAIQVPILIGYNSTSITLGINAVQVL